MSDKHQRRFAWAKDVPVHPNMINLANRFSASDYERSIQDIGVRMVLMSSLLPKLTAHELHMLCSERATVAIVDEDDNDDYLVTIEFDEEAL